MTLYDPQNGLPVLEKTTTEYGPFNIDCSKFERLKNGGTIISLGTPVVTSRGNVISAALGVNSPTFSGAVIQFTVPQAQAGTDGEDYLLRFPANCSDGGTIDAEVMLYVRDPKV